MEIIKSVLKQFYLLLIILGGVLFVINKFFFAPIYGGEGTFEGAGMLYSQMLEEEAVQIESFDATESSEFSPIIMYNAGTQKVGSYACFKEMFLIQNEDGIFVSGNTEENFGLYLSDIQNAEGDSVLVKLSKDDSLKVDEIPAPFVYDKDEDMIYFYSSGVYTVYIKVYGTNGGQANYEFYLPVEVM